MLEPRQKSQLILELRTAMAACERFGRACERTVISTGTPTVDRLLPLGGILPGSLIECLDERCGSGAETFAVLLTRAMCQSRGVLVVLDRERQFYPPALAAWGVALEKLILVRAANEAEELWATDQALRSRAVAAVWLRRDRLLPHDFRRLHLAAEEGETLGILLRPLKLRGLPTWADVQLVVQPRPTSSPLSKGGVGGGSQGRRLRVEVTRCRGGTSGRMVEIEIDDDGGAVREVEHHEALRMPAFTAMADSTVGRRTAGTARPAAALAPARSASG